ncbi:uncharacterized protein E0L32_001163 [Thyridium curvatum]|uniref:Uncharacterized protein n=1 Tax=Thyridium curvatum TaxID=1093900 RepID=A0A507AL85_9PEZI|nr:uncharacterized protein E0L32_001163 [Thyridium curvatum]TPX11345.1 hypothetical protein E0L32_001163 [Thyridium curvatum]
MNAAQNGPGPEGHEGLDASTKRAIRCDKESPCSNCRVAQRACSSTGIGQKPKETRQRVLISTQYERKIDQIEDRLGSIERLLQKLTTEPERGSGVHWPSRAPSHHDPTSSRGFTATPSSSSAAGTPGGVPANESRNGGAGGNDDSTFEGNSSLSAHTAFASEFLEHAVERTPLLDLSPNMSGALATLKQMVSMHNAGTTSQELRFPNQKPLPKGGLRELPMPPMEMVVEMLRAARGMYKRGGETEVVEAVC